MGAGNRPTRASAALAGAKSHHPTRPGFSLVEVLLAIFILGIGMIMVASVFPVGANWTRQAAEESVGQMIARNAMTVITKHYGRGGDLSPFLSPQVFANPQGVGNTILNPAPGAQAKSFQLQALPGFTAIPATERSFAFGSYTPFPAPNPPGCTYFWTALARLNPMHRNPVAVANDPFHGILPSTTYNYDLYILVFRKGAVDNKFSFGTTARLTVKNAQGQDVAMNGYVEVPRLRNQVTVSVPGGSPRPVEDYIPSVFYVTAPLLSPAANKANPYAAGQYNANSNPAVFGAVPPVGGIGIGVDSGTVFRQILRFNNGIPSGCAPQPMLAGQTLTSGPTESIIYCPPADGAAVSPLIYVYQTTISF